MHLARTIIAALALTGAAASQTVLYSTDFTTPDGWTFSNPATWGQAPEWDVDALPASPTTPYRSAPSSLNFNHDVAGLAWGHWWGSATSPVIDLTTAAAPRLEFAYMFRHEVDCQWDAFSILVRSATSGQLHYSECLSLTAHAHGIWRDYDLPLDPAWGAVRIEFSHNTIDDWNFNEQGSFVDDLRVIDTCGAFTVQCAGQSLANGAPGAMLSAAGTASITAGDLRLEGSGFPLHAFAAAFAGPDPAVLPIGHGVRCVGAGSSVRLAVAPTRDQGRPVWSLDLGAWPLAQFATVGQPIFVQTIFRDGASVNFSDALRIDVCP